MADYYISAVRYDSNHKRIVKVKYRYTIEGNYKDDYEKNRGDVVKDIDEDVKNVMTVYEKNGQMSEGEEVHVIVVDSEKFIRTDVNETPEDNLENLPEF